MNGYISPDPGHAGGVADLPTPTKITGAKRWLLPLILFTLIELAVLGGLFERSEMFLYDTWFRLRGVQNPGEQVVIVAIDDPSSHKLGIPQAWPRTLHARLLEKLKEARVVGFDMIFDTPKDPVDDQAMATTVAQHGKVVLASRFSFERDSDGQLMQVFQGPQQDFMAGARGLGFVNMPTDSDDVVRHFTAVDVNFSKVPFPSLSLAMYLTAIGLDPMEMDPNKIKLTTNLLKVGNQTIPLDHLNQSMPNFWGPQGTFKTYSYVDVLEGKLQENFKDKIVLVGATSALEHDDVKTPYTTSNLVLSGGLKTPGVEVHASIVQSFLEGCWYQQVFPVANIGFLLLAGLVVTVVVSGRGPWLGLAGAMTVVIVATVIVFVLWWHSRLWLNLAAPLALIFLTYAVMTATDFVQAEMGRRRTKAMFGRYVSPDVVEELMGNSGNIGLGGQRQLVTIMFCDIRGFTAYSENKQPEQVVNRLNEYLTVLTKIVFRHGGTLDKYLGDGLMAIFGAPVYYPDHIRRAIQAAVEMQEEVEELNKAWTKKNEPPLMIGVGINTGSVLVGNVGSPERMDYTVIGEDVNLASRVEGLTKTFGQLIIISERSVQMLEGTEKFPWDLQQLGRAVVKGFSLPVGVYTVVDKKGCQSE